MSKKIVLIKERDGYLKVALLFIVIGLVIYAFAMVACIAAGFGLWFLARHVWRSLVRERPDSPLVQNGLRLAPIARKVIAAVPCAMVSLCLIGSLVAAKRKRLRTA